MAQPINVADMPEQEFLNLVRGLQGEPTRPKDDLPGSVTQETRDALGRMTDALNVRIGTDTVSEEGKRMGIRPGIFLDTQKGVPGRVRFQLGLDENQLNQFKYLNEVYGLGNVDLSDDGRFIIRNQPSSTGVEDILVDPYGFDPGDVSQLGAQSGPMALGAAGAVASSFIPGGPILRVIASSVGGGIAQELAGGVQDAATRWVRNNTVNASEIAKERAKMAVVDAVLGVAAAGGAKAGTKVAEGIAGALGFKVGSTATKEAAQEVAEKTGVKFTLSPGQESESKLLLRGENILASRPGSASVMDEIVAKQQANEDELRRVFLDLPRTMTDDELRAALPKADEVGQQALGRLRKDAIDVSERVGTAVEDVRRAGTAEAQMIGDVDLTNPLSSTDVGRALRARATGDFGEFQTTMGARYEEFLSRPEIRSRTIPGNDIAAAAKAVENAFVPKARKGAVTTPLEGFVPNQFRSKLEELKSLRGKQTSVADLKIIRTSIDNSIKEGIAIPGTDVAQLEALRGVVDDGITQALRNMDKLPSAYRDTAPLTIWNELRSDYAKGMERFNRKPIREMLVRQGETGSLGDTALAERIMGNSPEALDNYNAYKEFFGDKSPEFQSVMRRARERTLVTALDKETGYIGGLELKNRLSDLRPEVAEELFGAKEQELLKIGSILEKTKGNLDLEELAELANQRGFTASKIGALIDAEEQRVKAYGNKLIKAAANGTLDAEKIKPSEFVRTLRTMDPDDAQRVMGVLSDRPDLVQQIKQLGVEDIWGRIQAGAAGHERISSRLLNEALQGDKGDVQRRTWETVIGRDTVEAMEATVKMLSSREFSTKAFSGGLAAQGDIQRLLSSEGAGEIKQLALRYLFGILYSGPLRRSVVNLMTSQDRGRFLTGVVASTPFIQGLQERFGEDGAFAMMTAFKEMIEPIQRKEMFIQGNVKSGVDPSALSDEEFEVWLKNATKR